jgi:hypothetical protein
MSPVPLRRPRRALLVPLLAVALVLAACGTAPPAPGDAVGDAVEQTLRGSFAFTLSIDADDAGRALLTEEDPKFAALLRTIEIHGTVDRPAMQFTVEALGFEVLEVRRVDATRTYVRLDPDAVTMLSEGEVDAADLRRELEDAPEEIRPAGEALLTGGWVAIDHDPDDLGDEDPFGAGLFFPLGPFGLLDGDVGDAFRRHVAADVGEFVDRFMLVTEREGHDDAVYDVALQARALAQAITEMLTEAGGPFSWLTEGLTPEEVADDFDDVPEAVRGLTVTVAERRVQRLALDVLEIGRSFEEDVPDGAVRIVADLSDHGSASPVVIPDDAVVLDLAELFELWWGIDHYPDFSTDVVIEEDAVVEVAPDDPEGEAPVSSAAAPRQEVMMLAVAQESRYGQGLGYADDLDGLRDHGFHPSPALAYGTCLYDEGEAFVVGAALDDEAIYLDSRQGNQATETDHLGCVPELAPVD